MDSRTSVGATVQEACGRGETNEEGNAKDRVGKGVAFKKKKKK